MPVPDVHAGEGEGNLVRLTSEEVMGLVQEFLSAKEFVLGGLSMRIHSRNPLTEYFFLSLSLFNIPNLISRFSELSSSLNRL